MLRFARPLMRPRAPWRRCLLERLFLQAADEKEDRHSITKRSSEAQRKYRPKKATQGPQEKTSRAPPPPVAAGVLSCRLMPKFSTMWRPRVAPRPLSRYLGGDLYSAVRLSPGSYFSQVNGLPSLCGCLPRRSLQQFWRYFCSARSSTRFIRMLLPTECCSSLLPRFPN